MVIQGDCRNLAHRSFGSGSASNIANDIMGLINNMMDTFIKVYLSINSWGNPFE